MTQLGSLKSELLTAFHGQLASAARTVGESGRSREEKARAINALAGSIKTAFSENVGAVPVAERPTYAMVLQYCFSVASLEYRHKVWPYEYMAFSRRIGELWEAFCSVAWDYPSRPGVARIPAPKFSTVRDSLVTRIKENIGPHGKRDELILDVDMLIQIIGDINMHEDEVFAVDGVPHVIDFKSGFGSNEKGNMLRLQTVGKAYRIWNGRTRLLLLVRQDTNNNYLRVLLRSGLWEVHTGAAAYAQIAELTGADVQTIRTRVIDWKADLSAELYSYLKAQPTDLTSYLMW